MENKNNKKQIAIMIAGVLLVMVLVVSITYAYFTAQASSNVQTITTGNLGLAFDDNTAILRATNISPLVREEAIPSTVDNLLDETNAKATIKTFSITNEGTEKLFVDISLDELTLPTDLKRYDFMYALYENAKNVSNGSFEYVEEGHKIMQYLVFEPDETKEYQLCIWIEETNLDQSLMMSEEFSAKITATGSAYWTSPEDDFDFDVGSGTIADYMGSNTSISIPSVINDVPVTSIDAAAFAGCNLNNVIIPNSVTSIGVGAFQQNNITSLVIPNSVVTISNNAFVQNNISTVILPSSVTFLGAGVFSSNELKSLVIPNSITNIFVSVFASNQLTSIIIPNSVTTIDQYVFWTNHLENLVIGKNVSTINNNAFEINQLKNVTIPSNVTSIGEGAFISNPNLTTITVKGKSEEPEGFDSGWYDSSVTNVVYEY